MPRETRFFDLFKEHAEQIVLGARSEVVEGVVVERGAVLSMGVYVGQSTRIYDRERDEILYGRIPAGAVVVPGSLPAANGKYSLYAAVIVKRVDAQTRAKVGINELLRSADEETGDKPSLNRNDR